MFEATDLSASAHARLVEQIADIIREFEEPDGSEEFPKEAAVRIVDLVLAAVAKTQHLPREGRNC